MAGPILTFAGSLAAANADTWATELGVLSGINPRLITTGRAGSSRILRGGISRRSLTATAGAGLIAFLAALPWVDVPHPLDRYSGDPLGDLCRPDRQPGRFIAWRDITKHLFLPNLSKRNRTVTHFTPAAHDTVKQRGLDGMDNDMVNLSLHTELEPFLSGWSS